MIDKTFITRAEKPIACVTFTLPDGIWATTIYLVGDFNDWNRHSHPLQHDGDNKWTLTIDLDLGHAYQFRYLCDCSHWLNDTQADAYVVNAYGSDNFVLITDPTFKQYRDERKSGSD